VLNGLQAMTPMVAPGASTGTTLHLVPPMLNMQQMLPYELHAAVGGLAGLVPPASEPLVGAPDPGTGEYTCTVCRKVFKRAANLIYHMTEHRPQAPPAGAAATAGEVSGCGEGAQLANGAVKCTDCDKEFATKYQAKKHFLRRHFSGDKPFACTKCHKKRFVVKEDLTMHMKACGNVFVCKCSIRLCSLGALKRHCKQFQHEPVSLEPMPENSLVHHPASTSGNAPTWQHDALLASQPVATAQSAPPSAQLVQTAQMLLPVGHELPATQAISVSQGALPPSAFSSLVAGDGQHAGNAELLMQGSQHVAKPELLMQGANQHSASNNAELLVQESNVHDYSACEATTVLDSAAAMASGFSGAQQLQSLAAFGMAQQMEMAAGAVEEAQPQAEWSGVPTTE